jgi:hypothetical protein
MINSLPCYIQNNMVYNMEGNGDGCGRSHSFNFGIGCGCNTDYSSLFQSTDGLCSKPKFKFALGSASHKL